MNATAEPAPLSPTAAPSAPGRHASVAGHAHTRSPARRRIWGPLLLGLVGAAVLGWLAHVVYRGFYYAETDDAYVIGHLHQVSPQIEGRVIAVPVMENQAVKTGDVLVQIDPLEYRLALEKANAALDQARAQAEQLRAAAKQADAQVTEATARVAQAQAQLAQSTAQLELAKLTLNRSQDLFNKGGVVSQADLDNARAASHAAEAAHAANEAAIDAVQSSVGSARAAQTSAHAQIAAAEANVAVAQAAVRDGQRKLDYTALTAPSDGRVGNKSVELGNYVLPGQVLMSIAEPDTWIVANFKETQLPRMHAGQDVEITIDALPGRTLHGTVDSLSPASGAQFALLPPDNATGNFNKVVQRVPVKILLDRVAREGLGARLRLGLSAVVAVRVH